MAKPNDYEALPKLDIAIIPPIHKGVIKKRHPRNRKKHQPRWLCLFEDRMVYSKEETGPHSGVIPLECLRAEIRTDERNAFEVCYDDMFQRRYQFVAKTDVDRAVWVWKINCCSYLKYGITRRPLSSITVSYLHETMGIDQIKKMLNSGYTTASEHFLSLTDGPGPGQLRKENSLDSEISTSSEERAYRAGLTETEYANLDECKDDGEGEDPEEEEQTFRVLREDLYFDPLKEQSDETNNQRPLSLLGSPHSSRQKLIFSTAEVLSAKAKMSPVIDAKTDNADSESEYIDHDSVNTIFDMLQQNEKAEENPYNALPDIDDIPPLSEIDQPSDGGPLQLTPRSSVQFLANAIKRVIHTPSASVSPVPELDLNLAVEDVIKVKCVGQRDFIEVDVSEIGRTYDSLLRCFSEELQLSTEDILLVRKLPDVLVRCDKDVRRIIAKQEFELELRK